MNTAISAEGSQGPLGAPLRKGASSQLDNLAKAAAILDIPTPESGQISCSDGRSPTPPSGQIKKTLSRVSRRLYSRVLLGMKLPGKYYFITWTSSPQSPPIEKSWRALRKQIKRWRPMSSQIYCITDEGYGVIHMILRLGKGEKRLDAKDVRAHWQRLHKATQIKMVYIPESGKSSLAAYLADQRSKRRLGGEMAWQDGIVRWRWSEGWLPKGFTKAFGRLWWSLQDLSPGTREKACTAWLHACHANGDKVMTPPIVGPEGEITYPKPPEIVPATLEQIMFDKEMNEILKTFGMFPASDSGPGPVPNKIKCMHCENHSPFSTCWEAGCE